MTVSREMVATEHYCIHITQKSTSLADGSARLKLGQSISLIYL